VLWKANPWVATLLLSVEEALKKRKSALFQLFSERRATMKYTKFAILFALFVAQGCSNENPVSEQDATMLPFTGNYSGSSVVAPSDQLDGFQGCSAALGQLYLEGSGQFTQLGGATVVHAHCTHPEPLSSDPLTLEVLYGKMAVIGAKGDEVYMDYTGTITYSDKAVFSGEFFITGGAGKYTNAHGSGTMTFDLQESANEFAAKLKGEISGPGASGK
jgi:hypothetical protein